MTQVNSAYPSTAYLSGFLRSQGHQVSQADLGIALFHRLFSKTGLQDILLEIKSQKIKEPHPSVDFFQEAFEDYLNTIEPVLNFLAGKDSSLALRIANRTLLPEGPRFFQNKEFQKELQSLFGQMGLQDYAKHLASLYIDDLADVVKYGIDPEFDLAKYGERLASSNSSFSDIALRLGAKSDESNLISRSLSNLILPLVEKQKPHVVGISVPFAGNLLAGLIIAKHIKAHDPHIKIVMGGGFVSTELRSLEDIRFFEFVDYLCFDDGELPLQRILEFLAGKSNETEFVRTWYLKNNQIKKSEARTETAKIPFKEIRGPDYQGLDLRQYISMLELPNPMHRMWSDFNWNKLILAHGCYWKKCQFCDTHLDYIQRFEPQKASEIIDQIIRIKTETGQSGFHFVDEAAPPALLKSVAQELIRRNIKITWWGNLRFDPQFDEGLISLMADSGCVAVTGGLEVASERLLKLMNKGISIGQVGQVTKRFSEAGIRVHAYLMYGFPTQTTQETIDSLEIVRQLFSLGCLQSAHWHRFVCTSHSPIARNPSKFGIQLKPIQKSKYGLFAQYEIPFDDPTATPNDELGVGLRKALYNFMHGMGINAELKSWFNLKVPKTTHRPDFVRREMLSHTHLDQNSARAMGGTLTMQT